MSELKSLIAIRPATKEDHSFIYATWLRSLRTLSPHIKHIPSKTYYEHHHQIIEHLLSSCQTIIATPKEDTNVILGYLTFGHDVLHYVYTKLSFRQMGIAKELFRHSLLPLKVQSTHWTQDALHVECFTKLSYNPYLLANRGIH